MRQPYMKFYPADWRSDTALRSCSYGARGLWIEMVAIMHEYDGRLCSGSRALTEKDLVEIARQTCGPTAEVRRYLAELRRNNVYSVDDKGVICSRRMVRDASKRRLCSESGKIGAAKRYGDPSLFAIADPIGSPHGESDGLISDSNNVTENSSEESTARASAEAMFARWFLDRGIETGAIPEHHKLNPGMFMLRNMRAAKAALSTYGEAECKARAERFFSAKVARRIRRSATIPSLLECWDFDDLKPAAPTSSYMERLRKAGKA